jgi:hypothetical protein
MQREHTRKPTSLPIATPLAVWASIAAYVAGVFWISIFETENSSLTVEFQDWSGVLIGAATITGVALGIKLLWWLYLIFGATMFVFSAGSIADDAGVQTIGAMILFLVSLILNLWPTVVSFETKRLRLNVEDPDDPEDTRPVPFVVLLAAVVLVAVLLSVVSAGG